MAVTGLFLARSWLVGLLITILVPLRKLQCGVRDSFASILSQVISSLAAEVHSAEERNFSQLQITVLIEENPNEGSVSFSSTPLTHPLHNLERPLKRFTCSKLCTNTPLFVTTVHPTQQLD